MVRMMPDHARAAPPETQEPGGVFSDVLILLPQLVWAVLLGSSFIHLLPDSSSAKLPRPITFRVASSFALVAAAWIGGAARRWNPPGRPGLWVAIGMTFGSLGDTLALLPESSLPAPKLLLAMILFGVGHVAYIWGFLVAIRARSGLRSGAVLVSALAWLIVVLLAWQITVNAAEPPTPLRWPALAYSLLLGGTAVLGSVLAWERPRFLPVAIGAALFLASDFILGYQAFRGGFPYDTDLCWGTYGPGQMLIVYGWLLGVRGETARNR